MTQRLFIGIVLDDLLRDLVHDGARVALGAATDPHGPVQLVRASGMHLTLHFLGDTEAERVPGIEAALRESLHGLRAPRLRLGGTGAFPDRGHARVLWAEVEDLEPDGLESVRERVLEAARGAGFDTAADERRSFRPHVTVARVRPAPGSGRVLVPDEFFGLRYGAEWTPRCVSLVESVPGGTGPPVYLSAGTFPIGGS